LLRGAGFRGVCLDLGLADAAAYDALAEALDEDDRVILGVVPTAEEPHGREKSVIDTLQRWLDMLGLDPGECGHLIGVSPTCGLVGSSVSSARDTLLVANRAAAAFT